MTPGASSGACNSVPRGDTSIVSSTMARSASHRASIDIDRAFFSKFLSLSGH